MTAAAVRHARAEDWGDIQRLLAQSGLPLDGASDHLGDFIVAHDGAAIVGCAAIERYDDVALLRSVAVAPEWRGRGVGELLVSNLIDHSRKGGIETLFLLTTTASNWFPRFGFQATERGTAPPALNASAEFRGACPSTATMMSMQLRQVRFG